MNVINNLHALIIEDHDFQRKHISHCLHHLGIQNISMASDGIEALGCVKRSEEQCIPIRLVICDLHMPNMDGVEFFRHLSKLHFTGHIIILTAMDESLLSSVSQMVRQYGIKLLGALSKPVQTQVLKNIINNQFINSLANDDKLLPDHINEKDIINALENGGLIPYFQPKYSFSTKECIGIETLARLQLPNGTIILPDHFLHFYKKLNTPKNFELAIYDKAFKLLNELVKHNKDINVSINICAELLDDISFYDDLLNLSRQKNIPTHLVTIELTEQNIFSEYTLAIEFLSRFRMNGFKISIDDFGTGYSSLKQLELLPFNELKIDRSFIIDIETDQKKQAIVKSIVDLAHRLKLSTVAEGVETVAAWDMAKKYGCDVCQGYLRGKPLTYKETQELLLV